MSPSPISPLHFPIERCMWLSAVSQSRTQPLPSTVTRPSLLVAAVTKLTSDDDWRNQYIEPLATLINRKVLDKYMRKPNHSRRHKQIDYTLHQQVFEVISCSRSRPLMLIQRGGKMTDSQSKEPGFESSVCYHFEDWAFSFSR